MNNLFPPLLPHQYEALKESITARGVDVRIICDQDGNVVDGFTRLQICDELGIDCPRELRVFDSEAAKYECALRANAQRRQLSIVQKRELIKAYIIADPELSPQSLATIIGCSKNTVDAIRSNLETTRQIDVLNKLRGLDGKQRPRRNAKVIVDTKKQFHKAVEFMPTLAPKTYDYISAKRIHRRATRQKRLAHATALPRLHHHTTSDNIEITRIWAMPNKWTFRIPPIQALLCEELKGCEIIVDPFAGQYSPATITNDINPKRPTQHHLDALEFLRGLPDGIADAVLYDPPYSIRQAKECYEDFGADKFDIHPSNMEWWAECKNQCGRVAKADSKVICCGWSSNGLGMNRGFEMKRILLVPHGGHRNDTIVTVEVKRMSACQYGWQ